MRLHCPQSAHRPVSTACHECSSETETNLLHPIVIPVPRVRTRTSDNQLGSIQFCCALQRIVIYDASLLINAVWEGLKVGGDGRDFFSVCLIAVGKTVEESEHGFKSIPE